MIIVDMNQVMLSNLLAQLGNYTNASIEENMVRHMVLNSLRSYRQKFFAEFGELVIACDNTNVWRKQVFPYYKANRKKNQEKSELNWASIFECMNKIRSELKEYFPYRVVDVESCEADDVIATLVKQNSGEKILILSGDKDFIQLHTYKNVKQFDPVRKKWITDANPEKYLHEHILKGDASDGVPNILSDDNCFVLGVRQKPLTQKRIDALNNCALIPDDMVRNFKRNQQLIDLKFIPKELESKIIESYSSQTEKSRNHLMNYFIANKLKNLMEHIGEF